MGCKAKKRKIKRINRINISKWEECTELKEKLDCLHR